MKRALLNEEQRREKPNDPGTSDMGLKVLVNLAVRSINQGQVLALTTVNLATLLEIVQNRNRSSPKGSTVPREQKNKIILILEKLKYLLLPWD